MFESVEEAVQHLSKDSNDGQLTRLIRQADRYSKVDDNLNENEADKEKEAPGWYNLLERNCIKVAIFYL